MKAILSLLFFFLSCMFLTANTVDINGTIYRTNGDTMNVVMAIPVYKGQGLSCYYLQTEIKYYDEQGKKKKLTADEITDVFFTYEGMDYHMVAKPAYKVGDLQYSGLKNVLLEQLVDGIVDVFRFSFWERYDMNGNGRVAGKYYLQKDGMELQWVKPKALYTSLKFYFRDCPHIDELEDRDYNDLEIRFLVEGLNRACIPKSYNTEDPENQD